MDERRQEEIEKEDAVKQHCLATGKSREQYEWEREELKNVASLLRQPLNETGRI